MLIKIGKMWTHQKDGGVFNRTHLSPSQLSQPTDKWFYENCVLTEEQKKKIPANMKMQFGGLIGRALQDMIVHNLTVDEVMKGKQNG